MSLNSKLKDLLLSEDDCRYGEWGMSQDERGSELVDAFLRDLVEMVKEYRHNKDLQRWAKVEEKDED